MINSKTGEVTPRTIRNRATWVATPEENNGISQTLPDQTLPIRTLIERYARGIPMPTKEPIWDGEDNDLPDPLRMDYAERQEYALKAAQELLEIQTSAKELEASYKAKNALKNDSAQKEEPKEPKQPENPIQEPKNQ